MFVLKIMSYFSLGGGHWKADLCGKPFVTNTKQQLKHQLICDCDPAKTLWPCHITAAQGFVKVVFLAAKSAKPVKNIEGNCRLVNGKPLALLVAFSKGIKF